MERESARQRLEAERRSVEHLIGTQRAVLARPQDEIFDELSATDQHQADAATETYEREQAHTILRMEEGRLADIDHALDKVAAGTYGRCETCGADVGDERLDARPDARFCADHERDWELRRFLARVPASPASPKDAPQPSWHELATAPVDEDEEQVTLSAEETAMHLAADEDMDGDSGGAGDVELALVLAALIADDGRGS